MMVIKYIFDRTLSFLGLLFLWPVLLVIAVLIRWKMPGGPVIFEQTRVGKDAKLFTIYKFRSMTPSHDGSSISVAGEARITPLGAKLRRFKIDELPELWNVLKGDMSFVGPRPDVPGYADKLEGEDRELLRLRPGITGPATLKYRSEDRMIANYVAKKKKEGDTRDEQEIALEYNDQVLYPDKVRINRYYLHHYSFAKDLQMLMCTLLRKQMKYNNEMI